MILGAGLLPKQAQPCHGSGSQPVKEITKQDKAQKKEKQEKVLRVEEANKTEEEQLSHPQKEEKKFDKKQSGSSIYKEEERNDTVRNTGSHKYLPIDICGDEGDVLVGEAKRK